MKSASLSTPKHLNLSPIEYTILRSYIMGLSEIALRQLLDCTRQELNHYLYDLCKKFRVENVYMLINKALLLGIISDQNYAPEYIKQATLAFIEAAEDLPMGSEEYTKNKWMIYSYLLEYHCFIYENLKIKKIPPKRD